MNYFFKLCTSTFFASFSEYALRHGVTTSFHVFICSVLCHPASGLQTKMSTKEEYHSTNWAGSVWWGASEVNGAIKCWTCLSSIYPFHCMYMQRCLCIKTGRDNECCQCAQTRVVTVSYTLMVMILYSDILLYRNWGKIEKQRHHL